MPLVQSSNQHRSRRRNSKPVPAIQSTAHTDRTGKQGENHAVSQLIPRWGYEVCRRWLRAACKQADNNHQGKQYRCGSKVAG